MSLPKSLLFNHSCMYAKCGGVAAYHIVWFGLCLRSVPGVCVLVSAVDSTGKNTHTRMLHKHKPIQTTRYAATPPHLVYVQLCLNNSDFSEDIGTP